MTCRRFAATTPHARRHWPVAARARTNRRSTKRPGPVGGSRPLEWLTADTAATQSKVLESGPPQSRQTIAQTLKHWKVDTDLAGLRDMDVLAKIAEDEQNTWRALWAQVDALLAKTCQSNSP